MNIYELNCRAAGRNIPIEISLRDNGEFVSVRLLDSSFLDDWRVTYSIHWVNSFLPHFEPTQVKSIINRGYLIIHGILNIIISKQAQVYKK